MTLGPSWRVRRTSGLLWPGFTKRFGAVQGVTYLWGTPVGRFAIVDAPDGGVQLRYLRWPVVDVLDADPRTASASMDAAGQLRISGGRRVRFCRFRLEPTDVD